MVRPKWFLPHFSVICEDKATTKVRIVFDSEAKFKEHSLNDMLHAGPKLQNDLVDILIHFRSEPVALVGDICEMFFGKLALLKRIDLIIAFFGAVLKLSDQRMFMNS